MSGNMIGQSYLNKSRSDKFLLVFDVPPILKGITSNYRRDNDTISPNSVQFSIFGSLIPDITVKATKANYAGSMLYVSSHSKEPYTPINVKFAVDSQYNNYWCIYSWLNQLIDQKSGIPNAKLLPQDPRAFDYQTDLTIYGLDEFDNKRIKFTYTKAFPTSLDSLKYDYQQTGEMEIQSGFTFVYSQLHVELVDQNLTNYTTV
jgi:hypothetical protein